MNKQRMSDTSMKSLFLQQSLIDSSDDYERSLTPAAFPRWDAVIITASNGFQAAGYEKQLEIRRTAGRLPYGTEFIIVPDRDGKRVGSAGSTLSVVRELKKRCGDFSGKRFLCIHAGGDSKRCPQYSALGKLFSPVPTTVGNCAATLFDMFMVTMASIPGRLREGMLLLSGDVILLFNPLMCDFGTSDAAVISFKENVETGKNHGVYVKSESGFVKKFLHKQTVETLKRAGAVDERDNCSIDTGAIELSPEIMEKLYSLVDTEEKYEKTVNDKVRLSLYGDIAYCLAEDSTLESFLLEKPEGEFCPELTVARKMLWEAISRYRVKLLNISPAKFVHFGSIPEILKLMDSGVEEYKSLGWEKVVKSSVKNEFTAGYNSVLSSKAKIGTGCYLEVSYIHSKAEIGNNCYISFVDIVNGKVPDNTVLHGLKQMNGKFVCRIFSVSDNPKNGEFFGKNLEKWAEENGISAEKLWNAGESHTLWSANLYKECDGISDAVDEALKLYDLVVLGKGDAKEFFGHDRKSLCSGFNDADSGAIIDWSRRMEELVRMDEVKKLITEKKPASEAKHILKAKKLTAIQKEWLKWEADKLDMNNLSDFSYAIRLKYYVGTALDDDSYIKECFDLIAKTVLSSTLANLKYNEKARIVSNETVVKLPLRVNWGGGWTDTAPHCLENGGVVINAAISLAGEMPVEVRMVKIPDKKIVFDSRDMDVHGEFSDIEPLQKTGDPFDPFALQKACLLACGVIPKEGGNLTEILTRMGGGFEMHSEVTNVPKGSGLGTSSILSAAAVKAVMTFTGMKFDDDTLYSTVLAMEQIMSTGGGWQDQVGGLTPGIKFITSEKGIDQKIKVEKVEISEETKKELSERFCVICSGQRRLARNLLRDVVGRYVGCEPDSLFGHKEIQKTAAQMCLALEKGDIDEFAALLDSHWELSRKIDAGSSNTLIDQIFISIDDLIVAKMVCGAGGGGFLQVVLKKGITKKDVHDRLKEVFQDFSVDVWDSEFVF